jgi:hypothetical protein
LTAELYSLCDPKLGPIVKQKDNGNDNDADGEPKKAAVVLWNCKWTEARGQWAGLCGDKKREVRNTPRKSCKTGAVCVEIASGEGYLLTDQELRDGDIVKGGNRLLERSGKTRLEVAVVEREMLTARLSYNGGDFTEGHMILKAKPFLPENFLVGLGPGNRSLWVHRQA